MYNRNDENRVNGIVIADNEMHADGLLTNAGYILKDVRMTGEATDFKADVLVTNDGKVIYDEITDIPAIVRKAAKVPHYTLIGFNCLIKK